MTCICEYRDELIQLLKQQEQHLRFIAHKYKDSTTTDDWNRVKSLLTNVSNCNKCCQKEDGSS